MGFVLYLKSMQQMLASKACKINRGQGAIVNVKRMILFSVIFIGIFEMSFLSKKKRSQALAMSSVLCFLIVVSAAHAGPVLSGGQSKAATQWFSQPSDSRGALPDSLKELTHLSKAKANNFNKQLWAAYKRGAIALGWDKQIPPMPMRFEKMIRLPRKKQPRIRPMLMDLGQGKKMPFLTLLRGKPKNKLWPMHITLHGGGRSSRKVTPHGWGVNTREWQVQTILFQRVFTNSGIYFIPRMVDDNDGRWWYKYNITAFDRMIRRGILFNHVDPNKIYIYGISEGGYGTCRLGPHMADRFAAVGSMAASGGADNLDLLKNLRNTPFRVDVGEKDTAYKRATFAKNWGKAMAKIKAAHPQADAFKYHLQMHKGRGHGIDYAPQPKWLVKHTRNPYPKKIYWTVNDIQGQFSKYFYNLGYDKTPERKEAYYFTASFDRKHNTVTLTAQQSKTVELPEKNKKGQHLTKSIKEPFHKNTINIYLNDKILDLDKPVVVMLNGKEVYRGKANRTAENIMRSISDRGDPYFVFPSLIQIKVP